MHATLIYDVTQILNLTHAKCSFIQFGTQFVLQQGLKELLTVLQVLFPILVEDEYVIQIKNHQWVGEGLQDFIH